MKEVAVKFLCTVLVAVVFVSALAGCGTILHGSVPKYRRTDDVDWAALILNVLFFWPGIFVDLATGGFWIPKG